MISAERARARASMNQIQIEVEDQRATGMITAQALQQQIHPDILARATAMRQAVESAANDVQEARRRVQQHQTSRPQTAADVPTWARHKAELAAELEAYEGLFRDAQDHDVRAAGEVRAAHLAVLHQVWNERSAAFDQQRAAFQAEKQQLTAQLQALAQREATELNERFDAELRPLQLAASALDAFDQRFLRYNLVQSTPPTM